MAWFTQPLCPAWRRSCGWWQGRGGCRVRSVEPISPAGRSPDPVHSTRPPTGYTGMAGDTEAGRGTRCPPTFGRQHWHAASDRPFHLRAPCLHPGEFRLCVRPGRAPPAPAGSARRRRGLSIGTLQMHRTASSRCGVVRSPTRKTRKSRRNARSPPTLARDRADGCAKRLVQRQHHRREHCRARNERRSVPVRVNALVGGPIVRLHVPSASLFLTLHAPQSKTMFSQVVNPPRLQATRWSACSCPSPFGPRKMVPQVGHT